jgi:hypothetical protein
VDKGRLIRVLAVILLCAAATQMPETAVAKACGHSVEAVGSAFAAQGRCVTEPERTTLSDVRSSRGINPVRYERRSVCGPGLNGEQGFCIENTCPPGEQIYRLWQVAPPPVTALGLVCSGDGPPAVAAAPPQVTDAMVLQAFRRIPLPSLRSQSQPADKTLINFDTIFYTRAEPLTRQLTLLGQRVRLEIEPSRFEWVHGDGTTRTTTTPGAPYPAKDVVYRYADAHRTVAHRVVVTWSARWSLNGGPLQPVSGTVTTTGPATPLRIAEASPALSGAGR